MNTSFLLNLGLAFHLAGLSVTVGVSLTKFLAFRRLSHHPFEHQIWTTGLGAARRLNLFLGIGMGLAILSGILMMHLAYSAFMYQIWFQLKLGAIVLIIVSGIVVNRSESKLRRKLTEDVHELSGPSLSLARRLRVLSGFQFLLFMLIIVFASFRFT